MRRERLSGVPDRMLYGSLSEALSPRERAALRAECVTIGSAGWEWSSTVRMLAEQALVLLDMLEVAEEALSAPVAGVQGAGGVRVGGRDDRPSEGLGAGRV